jgi:2-polyprenyl-3-methyl-5-hydroxy-6-metoxy-1,4-benzoquinol methylase
MYAYLSQYYDLIFDFNPKMDDFMKSFTKTNGIAIDLGCGTGRLTHLIHEHHMNVVGVDLDTHMIEVAKKKYPNILFKVEDMLKSFQSKTTYDLVTCFGNTIVHLNPNQLNQLFDSIKIKIKKEGYMVIQTLNYDEILKSKPTHLKTIEKEGIEFIRSYTYEKESIIFKTELLLPNHQLEGSTVIYPYVINDFIHLAKKYNFSLTIYGDMIENQVKDKTNHIYYVFKN